MIGRGSAGGGRRTRLLRGASTALLSAVLVVAASGARAEPPSSPEKQLGQLKKLSLEQLFDLEVTTVSQKPESLSQTAAAIHVVTQDDIRRMGALNIPEALRNIPGVEVARVNARDYAITARGFNGTVANKLLVLIDGRSVYTPLYSGVFWDVQDTFLEDVEQIEVIRGPGATVWGANAVNGVINIITKDAAHAQGFTVTGGGGNAERGFGGVRYGGTLGPRGFFRVYAKSFDRDASVRPNGQEAGDGLRMSQGGLRIDWTPSASDAVTVQGDVYGGSGRQPGTDGVDLSGGNVLAQWSRRFSTGSDVQLRTYYDRTHRDIPATFGETLDTYDATLRHRFGVADRHDVVWGLEYRRTQDQVQNGPALAFLPARLARNLATAFIQSELALAENRLHVTVGSKFEHNDYTGFEYQPSGRFAWMPTSRHTVWAAASRAVRTPSRIDRDLFAPPTPPHFLVGSPDFDSEVLRAFELGYKTQAAGNLTGSVATFYNRYDKLRSVEGGPPYFLANGFEGQTYGIEAEATCQVTSRWRVNPGYTFLRLDLDTTPSSTDTTFRYQEGDSPRHQLFVRSSLTLPRELALDITVRHVGELPNQRVPAYTTADARLAWQAHSAVELAIVGRDLFDPRHPEFGAPGTRREVERSVYGKATCRF
ncbi:MAG TPA: TonB-dependent receptor [Candidatus Eisenbacteria bacterium]|nr:TonB-dependent receptor [Candidatus Eisenbacteria bacterium]